MIYDIPTAEERAMQKQVKSVTSMYQQQVTVNKTITAKILSFEKQLLDEKRNSSVLEKRLSDALPASSAQYDQIDKLLY